MTDPARGPSLRRSTNVGFGVVLLLLLTAVTVFGFGLVGVVSATGALTSRYDPAVVQAHDLFAAFVDQETGVRGFVLTGQEQFLAPYDDGRTAQATATAQLRPLLDADPGLRRDVDAVLAAADDWDGAFATVVIAETRAGERTVAQAGITNGEGKRRFDAIRARYATLDADVLSARAGARDRLASAKLQLIVVVAVAAPLIVVAVLVGWWQLRRSVIAPISRLAAESRIVRDGALHHAVRGGGPAEIDDLAMDVETMRQRVVAELAEVSAARAEAMQTTASLARSNADLEQFAYVASHDLQEPLRKVSNFCQLLERQYADDLDDRARQYIDFAVDGAKRMQTLIIDLLAFSRVGRNTDTFRPVDTAAAAREALANLGEVVPADATVDVGDLPTLPGDATLLTTLFQNLLGNALKYRGMASPHVRVTAERQEARTTLAGPLGHEWVFTVADNGIGIEPQYAQRIFVIFQRLHLRDSYGGTGIGLALCKKIVEYHGGRIWLDPSDDPGARFCFTIPEGSA